MVFFCFFKRLFLRQKNFGYNELHQQEIMCSGMFRLLDYCKSICSCSLVTLALFVLLSHFKLSTAESVHCLFLLPGHRFPRSSPESSVSHFLQVSAQMALLLNRVHLPASQGLQQRKGIFTRQPSQETKNKSQICLLEDRV